MRRVICEQFGDTRHLRVVEQPRPQPGSGELLIEVAAVGVSFVDGLVVRGAYQVKPPLPFTPGNCVAGKIVSVGAGVDPGVTGMRVAAVMDGLGGAYASQVVVKAADAVALPAELSPELAASAMESYLTLIFATTHRVSIARDEYVVVLGAGGGIGTAAVDVARSLGAKVIAVASSEEKRKAALSLGAAVAIGYEDLKEQIRSITDGGADVVIDPVGGLAAESALRALATDGRYCVFGFASGEIPRFPANVVLMRNRSIVGIDWGDWSRETGGAPGNATLLTDVLRRIARGDLRPPEPTLAPLADAGRVLKLIEERRVVGKYVLVP